MFYVTDIQMWITLAWNCVYNGKRDCAIFEYHSITRCLCGSLQTLLISYELSKNLGRHTQFFFLIVGNFLISSAETVSPNTLQQIMVERFFSKIPDFVKILLRPNKIKVLVLRQCRPLKILADGTFLLPYR